MTVDATKVPEVVAGSYSSGMATMRRMWRVFARLSWSYPMCHDDVPETLNVATFVIR
jgi:hypothetical protein